MTDAAISALPDGAHPPTQYYTGRECIHCGKFFYREGRELRKYCSDECMKERKSLIGKGLIARQCDWCRNSLKGMPSATKFCSPICRDESARKYRRDRNVAEAEKLRGQAREWYYANKDRAITTREKWGKDNPEKLKAISAKRRSTPHGKLSNSMRVGVHKAIKKGKSGQRTFNLLGYSVDQLKEHLERQFTTGMTWENYGEWHIDHIVPVSSFQYDSADHPDFKACWALTNLRPLWSEQNISKHSKRLFLI